MSFWVIATMIYFQKYKLLDSAYQFRIEKFIDQLEEQGDLVGKPLAGLPFFREKKFNGNRLYYLVYKEWNAILIADISDKKEQADVIQKIKFNLDIHKEFVRKTIGEKQFTSSGGEARGAFQP